MIKIETFAKEFNELYSDAFIIKKLQLTITHIIQDKDEFRDSIQIHSLMTYGDMRELAGFHAHKMMMEALLTVTVARYVNMLIDELNCDHLRDKKTAHKLTEITSKKVDRCLPQALTCAKAMFGTPSDSNDTEIKRYLALILLRAKLTKGIATIVDSIFASESQEHKRSSTEEKKDNASSPN